jgi:hypothetical protein
VGKPEEERPLRRQRHGWVNNIYMVWINLAQDKEKWSSLENASMNLQVP